MGGVELNGYLFTSESVTEGHPDKVCDQISDAILDEFSDPNARVACETAVTNGLVLVMGEVTAECYVDIPRVVRNVVAEIGYNRAKFGFDAETCGIITAINEQSPDIAMGVNHSLEAKKGAAMNGDDELGAGDQGLLFGYATDENPGLHAFAHHPGPRPGQAPGRAQEEQGPPLSAAGWQDPGDSGVRGQPARPRSYGGGLDPARSGRGPGNHHEGRDPADHQGGDPAGGIE